jgi:hypothetical protein
MSSAGRTRCRIPRKIILAVRCKDPGIDIAVAVVPEADAVAPDRVVVDIEIGERPEQRPDSSISAIAVSPPPVRDAAAMPAGQRCSRDDLSARRRVAEQATGIHGTADILRSEGRVSNVTVTSKRMAAVQSPQ